MSLPRLLLVRSLSHDPWTNLALEELLLQQLVTDDLQAVLYLWQNQDTVVIGRNQNAWAECLAGLLETEGGRLARRSTGGGAVFHDLGNLNFSIILPRPQFDLDRNFAMLLDALDSQGITVERSGRNDILAGGLKCSGNAFGLKKATGLHHGTLLIHSDTSQVARYLTASPAKLQARGVASVRSRITNLQAINPDITVASMSEALELSFIRHFGLGQGKMSITGHFGLESAGGDIRRALDADYQDDPRLLELRDKHASWSWRYGETLKFDALIERRLDWGTVQAGFQVEQGMVRQATFYTDALDSDFFDLLPALLAGRRFHSADLADALLQQTPDPDNGIGPSRRQMAADLAGMIREQNW